MNCYLLLTSLLSGSLIFQNDKLVRAVTHVFVDGSSKGYCILIENMLFKAKRIKYDKCSLIFYR